MKTIKIIDLLNKIANGEEVPKKIKLYNQIYVYDVYDDSSYYLENSTHCLWNGYCFLILNEEAEIIEEDKKIEIIEEDKKIEKISVKTNNHNVRKVANKINELIDELYKLKEQK